MFNTLNVQKIHFKNFTPATKTRSENRTRPPNTSNASRNLLRLFQLSYEPPENLPSTQAKLLAAGSLFFIARIGQARSHQTPESASQRCRREASQDRSD